jgi:hypothetical protein
MARSGKLDFAVSQLPQLIASVSDFAMSGPVCQNSPAQRVRTLFGRGMVGFQLSNAVCEGRNAGRLFRYSPGLSFSTERFVICDFQQLVSRQKIQRIVHSVTTA